MDREQPDQEVAAIMHDLSRMQTWTVMLATRQTPGASEAMDLVQRTRCLIVERLYPSRQPSPDTIAPAAVTSSPARSIQSGPANHVSTGTAVSDGKAEQ